VNRAKWRLQNRMEDVSTDLVLNHPHHPTSQNRAHNEEREALGSVLDHVARRRALGNAEDDRSEEGEDERGAEMGKLHRLILSCRWRCRRRPRR